MSEATNRLPLGVALTVCLTCGYAFDGKTPAGRCPREAEHPDPAETLRSWTVIGVSADDDEPEALTAIEGEPTLHDGTSDHGWWAEVVVASNAEQARRFAVDERRDMLGLV